MERSSQYQNAGGSKPKSNMHLRVMGFCYLKPQCYQTLSLKNRLLLKFHASSSSEHSEFSLSRPPELNLAVTYIEHRKIPSSHDQYCYLQCIVRRYRQRLARQDSWTSSVTTTSAHEGLTTWHFLNKWQILKQKGQMISEEHRQQRKKNLYGFWW